VERLPHHWNEFWVKNSKTSLLCHIKNTQDHFKKTVDKQIARIDNIRKHVGDMDVKIFHALDIKNKRKAQEIDHNSPDFDFNHDDEAYVIYYSKSDEGFDRNDNWSCMDIQEPDDHHHCQFVGHSRHR
jgi:hypothetical protein